MQRAAYVVRGAGNERGLTWFGGNAVWTNSMIHIGSVSGAMLVDLVCCSPPLRRQARECWVGAPPSILFCEDHAKRRRIRLVE